MQSSYPFEIEGLVEGSGNLRNIRSANFEIRMKYAGEHISFNMVKTFLQLLVLVMTDLLASAPLRIRICARDGRHDGNLTILFRGS